MNTEQTSFAEYVKARISYDAETGNAFWLFSEKMPKNWNSRWAGKPAGRVSHKGYVELAFLGRRFLMHRVVWLLYYGQWPYQEIDHINGVRSDNRISNLRVVSSSGNKKNQGKRVDNTSGTTGVNWCKKSKKWRASIKENGSSRHLGLFSDIDEAIACRKSAEVSFGFYENERR